MNRVALSFIITVVGIATAPGCSGKTGASGDGALDDDDGDDGDDDDEDEDDADDDGEPDGDDGDDGDDDGRPPSTSERLCDRLAECGVPWAGASPRGCADAVGDCARDLTVSERADWGRVVDACLAFEDCGNFAACYEDFGVCVEVEIDTGTGSTGGEVDEGSTGAEEGTGSTGEAVSAGDTGGPASCDDECSTCTECASESECADEWAACLFNRQCPGFVECFADCVDVGSEACADLCTTVYPLGADDALDLLVCDAVACGAC